ncbi:M15 family metallopeptidase [Flavobacteriales bacterium]|nr:M15 family metallopeptidase [Flavobacteriales bacterium]
MKNYFYLLVLLIISCETNIKQSKENEPYVEVENINSLNDEDLLIKISEELKTDSSCMSMSIDIDSQKLENYLISFGLVDIQSIEPNLRVDLKYSTTDNFVGIDMYGDLDNAFSQPDVAQKLKKAYDCLQELDSTLTLLVFDCVRPVFVQQKMWDTLTMPIREKTKFLSNPKNRSIHNYGAAVDITISTKNGEELDMGTPFDFIGKLAHPREERKMLKEGKLTKKQIKNRVLLRKVMKKAGFFNIQTEWWHWNSCSRNTAKRKYKLVE